MLLLGVLAVVVAFSNSFGRAEPTGAYRPELPPSALENGCYPLPAGVQLDFPHQVRTDGDVDGRRLLLLHYDLVDNETAEAKLVEAFEDRGFDQVRPRSENVDPDAVVMRKPGIGEVSAVVRPIPGTTEDSIVRGTIELDLPVAELASDDPICLDPFSTKRFPDESSTVPR